MALERTITLFVGEDKQIEIEVFDQAGLTTEALEAAILTGTATMQDVATWTFTFFVRKGDKTTGVPLLSKTSAAGISVTGVYNAARGTNTQRVVVAIEDTDTASADGSSVVLSPKTYRYSLKRADDGSETVIVLGNFELAEATTR